MPTTFHPEAGWPTIEDMMVSPSTPPIYQALIWLVASFCRRISGKPSLLKSAVPTTRQLGAAVATIGDCWITVPFGAPISHMLTALLCWFCRTSIGEVIPPVSLAGAAAKFAVSLLLRLLNVELGGLKVYPLSDGVTV